MHLWGGVKLWEKQHCQRTVSLADAFGCRGKAWSGIRACGSPGVYNEAVAKRLHQPMGKFPTNLQECGNISAASVPILLDNVKNHGMIKKGSKIVLEGFGAGLTWGATVLRW